MSTPNTNFFELTGEKIIQVTRLDGMAIVVSENTIYALTFVQGRILIKPLQLEWQE